jgi:hypothetical protein
MITTSLVDKLTWMPTKQNIDLVVCKRRYNYPKKSKFEI